MHMDDPQWAVKRCVTAIEKDSEEAYLGFPESRFARLNLVLPGVVGRASIEQVPALGCFAQEQ